MAFIVYSIHDLHLHLALFHAQDYHITFHRTQPEPGLIWLSDQNHSTCSERGIFPLPPDDLPMILRAWFKEIKRCNSFLDSTLVAFVNHQTMLKRKRLLRMGLMKLYLQYWTSYRIMLIGSNFSIFWRKYEFTSNINFCNYINMHTSCRYDILQYYAFIMKSCIMQLYWRNTNSTVAMTNNHKK